MAIIVGNADQFLNWLTLRRIDWQWSAFIETGINSAIWSVLISIGQHWAEGVLQNGTGRIMCSPILVGSKFNDTIYCTLDILYNMTWLNMKTAECWRNTSQCIVPPTNEVTWVNRQRHDDGVLRRPMGLISNYKTTWCQNTVVWAHIKVKLHVSSITKVLIWGNQTCRFGIWMLRASWIPTLPSSSPPPSDQGLMRNCLVVSEAGGASWSPAVRHRSRPADRLTVPLIVVECSFWS